MRYRSKPIECEAMRWSKWVVAEQHTPIAVEDAQRVVAWVNANGGEARYEPASQAQYRGAMLSGRPARIAVRTINGWAFAAPGHYVVMGSATFETFDYVHDGYERTRPCRDFYRCDPETFEKRWLPVAAGLVGEPEQPKCTFPSCVCDNAARCLAAAETPDEQR